MNIYHVYVIHTSIYPVRCTCRILVTSCNSCEICFVLKYINFPHVPLAISCLLLYCLIMVMCQHQRRINVISRKKIPQVVTLRVMCVMFVGMVTEAFVELLVHPECELSSPHGDSLSMPGRLVLAYSVGVEWIDAKKSCTLHCEIGLLCSCVT